MPEYEMSDRVTLSPRRLLLGLVLAVYLYSGLGLTAVIFYETYHLTGVDLIYYAYSAFKAAGYYFGQWQYQAVACVLAGLMTALPWWECLKNRLGAKV